MYLSFTSLAIQYGDEKNIVQKIYVKLPCESIFNIDKLCEKRLKLFLKRRRSELIKTKLMEKHSQISGARVLQMRSLLFCVPHSQ
jgi:hypothetical protein